MQVQVPSREDADKSRPKVDRDVLTETPWDWVGFFDDDLSWPSLFDEIEEERDQNLIGGS